jgi:Na+-translocating ferredoxin:NAD+ oxidoreductase RnfG subunit
LYAKKLISIVEKITKKKIKKEDKNHLKRRIQGYIRKDFSENKLSHLSLLIEKLEKVTNKEVLLFAK